MFGARSSESLTFGSLGKPNYSSDVFKNTTNRSLSDSDISAEVAEWAVEMATTFLFYGVKIVISSTAMYLLTIIKPNQFKVLSWYLCGKIKFPHCNGIVVWRPWMLYPRSLVVKIVLVLCMIGSLDATASVYQFDFDFGNWLQGMVYAKTIPLLSSIKFASRTSTEQGNKRTVQELESQSAITLVTRGSGLEDENPHKLF
ncbi:hypothetical protein K435DRAFT_803834 [Dendrothele bispora CBS 962.96]|uniref:Uncharacterized protein n=1 Tax=Dendrothele bispora (strain CBS 962.96) TaxID=1314807 RepID=A0A4S8LG84_DENBC|nr:hypothetical protein K435DRAFT_803834 [Dendrothele bispora CBS 962.96]